jgi:hypothetical protein
MTLFKSPLSLENKRDIHKRIDRSIYSLLPHRLDERALTALLAVGLVANVETRVH